MRHLNRQRFALLVFILGIMTTAVTQITPSQDSYTNSANATVNFGTATTLGVVSAATSIQTTYIQFDLSSVPAGFTGSNVAKATLKLYVNSVTTPGSFNVDYVNGTWSEKTITASLSPALGGSIASSVPLSSANVHDYVVIDVTPAVSEWLSGAQANDGIALVANSPLSATFDSKENTSQSHPAELDIVFTSGGTISGVTTASGSGLIGGGTTGALSLGLLNTCTSKQILQWNGSAWVCAAAGTGTISGVTAGTGLTGGGTSGAVTLNLDTTKVPLNSGNNNFTGNNTFTGNTTSGTPNTAIIQSGAGIALEIQSLSSATGVNPALTVYESSNNGSAVFANAPSANAVGVYGTAGAIGVWGNSAKTGVQGQTTTGTAGAFVATSGGKVLSGQNGSVEVFSVSNTGAVNGSSFAGDGSNLFNLNAAQLGGLPANSFATQTGYNNFLNLQTFNGNAQYMYVGDPGCGPGYAGIGFGALYGCTNYSLIGNGNDTLINRPVGGSILFREGNGTEVAINPGGALVANANNNSGAEISGINTATNATGVFGSATSGYGFVTDSHVSQARGMGGWAKAMAFVDFSGTIYRCFNSQMAGSAASTPPCGLTVTGVQSSAPYYVVVDFGFEIDDRFVPLSFISPDGNQSYQLSSDYGNDFGLRNSQVIVIDNASSPSPFYVLVF